jgi:hypothetical protein
MYVGMLKEFPQDEQFHISVLYKDNDDSEIQELLI